MILYYSGIRSDMCSPTVVFGDRACVMLSFYECGRANGEPAAGFLRLKEERLSKRKQPYLAYRDYQSDRENETLYAVQDLFGEILAGPTSLLTSLVMDYKPRSNLEFIIRLVPKTKKVAAKKPREHVSLYKAVDGKWVRIPDKPMKQRKPKP